MGNILNQAFVDKVKNIYRALGPISGDSSWVLKKTMEKWEGANNIQNKWQGPASRARSGGYKNMIYKKHTNKQRKLIQRSVL